MAVVVGESWLTLQGFKMPRGKASQLRLGLAVTEINIEAQGK